MSLYKSIVEGDYGALLVRVREASGWTEESLDMVHAALVAWTERALSLPPAKSGANCAALYDLIGRLRATHGDEALQAVRPGTPSEWRGLEQVLDERIAKVNQGAAQREAVLQRKHVETIVAMLDGGNSLNLTALRERLRVSESVLSQVLGMMETAQLIERERGENDARIKCVRLTQQELELRGKASRRQVRAEAKENPTSGLPHSGISMSWALAGAEQ